jgi:acyl carrier protein
MTQRQEIVQVIYDAIDDMNDELDVRIPKAEDTVLFGEGSALDSIGLVRLILAIEEGVEDDLNVSITLADEKAMSRERSPFRTVSSLAEYVRSLLPAVR